MLNYLPSRTFRFPSETGPYDALPDGRWVAAGVSSLWVEDAAGSGTFSEAPAPFSEAASFLRVRPDGRRAAAGLYGRGVVVSFPLPYSPGDPIAEVAVSPYDAAWAGTLLLVSGQGEDGAAGTSAVAAADFDAGTAVEVVTGIEGASGGVAVDVDGNMYTGNGAAGGSATGEVRAFRPGQWRSALAGGRPADWAVGAPVVNLLSAAFLAFDGGGNLVVGGGYGVGPAGGFDGGYAGVAAAAAVRAALGGGPPVQPDPPPPAHVLQRLDPTPAADDEFWAAGVSRTRGEIVLRRYGDDDGRAFTEDLRRVHVPIGVQLGDTPEAWAGPFAGASVSAPLRMPAASEAAAGAATVRLLTRRMQTLGGAAHRVTLGGRPLGTLASGYADDTREVFDFPVDLAAAAAGGPTELRVEVDDTPGRGMADDFLLDAVEVIYAPA